MKRASAVQWIIRVMVAALALAAAVPAYAQGCAMCYNDAAAAKSAAIQALRSGTLILLFPVLLLFGGILVMTFRSRNRYREARMEEEIAPGDPAVLASGRDARKNLIRAEEMELVPASRGEAPLSG
jgi:preprotein translocase subunit YajC